MTQRFNYCIWVGVLSCLMYSPLFAASRQDQPPQLLQCPKTPNCVSSLSDRSFRFVEPLRYDGSQTEAFNRLINLLLSMKRTKVILESNDYIHAEVTSQVFRFVDDVDFWFHSSDPIIHVRSASRKGLWDMGVNKIRVEKIRQLFESKSSENDN